MGGCVGGGSRKVSRGGEREEGGLLGRVGGEVGGRGLKERKRSGYI